MTTLLRHVMFMGNVFCLMVLFYVV